MKRIIFILITLHLSLLTSLAQTKGEQVKHIREVYAQAHQMAADNGKNGAAPLDIWVSRIETDPTVEIEEDEDLQFYFKRPNNGKAICYLITRKWEADGHTDYREFLFDPTKGHLLFAFMKAETHAGFKVETRYYYDAQGRCIEQKHKVQDEETTADAHSWNDAKSEMERAARYVKIVNALLNTKSYAAVPVKGPEAATKNEIVKRIREAYTAAKDKVAQCDKGEGSQNKVEVVIHDQKDASMPPQTTTLNYYYDVEYLSDTYYHCYFLSEKKESMYEQSYEEYLTDNAPEQHNLIFNYCHASAEGQELEARYYYDTLGHCVEAKCNIPDYDDRMPTRNRAGHYFSVFNTLMK